MIENDGENKLVQAAEEFNGALPALHNSPYSRIRKIGSMTH